MFGYKKLIEQYETRLKEQKDALEAHISSLKLEIEDLRKMAFPPNTGSSIPLVHMEADAVITGQQDVIRVSDQEEKDNDEAISERDRLLSGNY